MAIPFCITETDTDEYIKYNKETDFYIFDTHYGSKAIRRIEEELVKRNGTVQIIFTNQIIENDFSFVLNRWGHSEVWFSPNIVRMQIMDHRVVFASLMPCDTDVYVANLPFKDIIKAFRIANHICNQTNLHHIGYNIQLLLVAHHVLAQLLNVHIEENAENDDYNPSDPSSWTEGVFCSQVVLLFLKECVIQNVLEIPDTEKKRRFLAVYSKTCLPHDLEWLLKETWD